MIIIFQLKVREAVWSIFNDMREKDMVSTLKKMTERYEEHVQ